ncbi:MAG TPA: hypothetical protein VHY31_05670 [Streptosporangiaceae bacterium]|nr:hypothetical protein [Streptosporangiaceae bacterium]
MATSSAVSGPAAKPHAIPAGSGPRPGTYARKLPPLAVLRRQSASVNAASRS